jgi:hypothetical protein
MSHARNPVETANNVIAASREQTVPRGSPASATWSRGPAGVKLVTSDAHRGLVEAIGATVPGAAGLASRIPGRSCHPLGDTRKTNGLRSAD